MTKMSVHEFANRTERDVPHLFSQTREFRFFDASGALRHTILPRGPKGITVIAVTSTGHQAGFVEEHKTALTIPLTGSSEVSVADKRFVVRPSDMFAIGPSERHSKLFASNDSEAYSSYTILADSCSHGVVSAECCWHKRDNQRHLQLRRLLDLSFEMFSSGHEISETAAALVEVLIEEMFLEILKLPAENDVVSGETHDHDRIVREALEFMATFHGDPISILDVAAAIGVSMRRLQLAFKNRKGASPRRILAELRIQRLRMRLLNPDPATSVTSAALESGLCHLGRCAKVYYGRYGELPFETLQKSREASIGSRFSVIR